jgi:hypothetical protein
MIKELEIAKKKLGGDAAIIMSQDEEGNSYGDILMFEVDNCEDMAKDDYYRGYHEDPAVRPEGRNGNKNVFIIFPNL